MYISWESVVVRKTREKAMAITFKTLLLTTTLLLLFSVSFAEAAASSDDECDVSFCGECYDKREAMRLKSIAIPSILVASMVGIGLPLVSRSVPALAPDRNLFVVVKAFASGVILATGYMHVLPDAFHDLSSPCLPERPWGEFPFATFVAMVSALPTLMVDSFMTSLYNRRTSSTANVEVDVVDYENTDPAPRVRHKHGHGHGHGHGQLAMQPAMKDDKEEHASSLQRNRIIAQVLEMGILVHSVVIGLSMGASQNPCTIRPLVAAICFRQLFEGMGLGGVILQAEYGLKMKAMLAFFFATTTPFGIALGIGLSGVYSDNSPTALIVVGILNASSAGLLNYMALVDLLAADFMGSKLQKSIKLQMWAFCAVFLGAGGMSLLAKWA